MDKRIFILLGWLSIPGCLWAQSDTLVHGSVFLDRNQNGLYDKGERGLSHILISNGDTVVQTDKRGNYAIPAAPGMSVFPIIPTGYTPFKKGEKVNNTAFFYFQEGEMPTATEQILFPLVREKQSPSFRIGAIGDIQVGDTAEIAYANKTLFKELLGRQDMAFHMVLGDLLNDNLQHMSTMKNMLNTLPVHSWAVAGNHDRNVEQAIHKDDIFNENFGASTYAFNYGNIHFIVFNNVYATGKRSYEGRLSEVQLRFLANDLKYVPKDRQVVICQHIPMVFTRNKDAVLDILKAHSKVLILSAHMHTISRHFLDHGRIQEIVVGAPSGTWWTGEKDWQGIPHALMQDGSPRNYFTVDFNKKGYTLQYKGIGLDASDQASVTMNGDTVISNIYAGGDSTRVRMKIDGGDWLQMEKVRRIDPYVLHIIERNRSKTYPTTGSRLIPLRKRFSPHIWQQLLPINMPSGIHQLHIEAEDPFGYKMETPAVIRFVKP